MRTKRMKKNNWCDYCWSWAKKLWTKDNLPEEEINAVIDTGMACSDCYRAIYEVEGFLVCGCEGYPVQEIKDESAGN